MSLRASVARNPRPRQGLCSSRANWVRFALLVRALTFRDISVHFGAGVIGAGVIHAISGTFPFAQFPAIGFVLRNL
jgi:hypothetical protein